MVSEYTKRRQEIRQAMEELEEMIRYYDIGVGDDGRVEVEVQIADINNLLDEVMGEPEPDAPREKHHE